MNTLRALMRRLDPWAALVLGGLLAMAVVILLATPGPWQRVVGSEEPAVRLEAPAPDDVAVFTMAGHNGACSGVVWLHVDAGREALTAVVVAPQVSGSSPGDGFAPIAAIADSAGPGPAAEALGRALGVSMDAWVALDRKATELAVQALVPMTDVRAARTRYSAALDAWRGRGTARSGWATQYGTLSVALPQVPFQDLGVVAFANYVLGFGFVRSDLTLQGATSLGGALRNVNRDRVDVRGAPVVVEVSRGAEVWHADASHVEPLRQSLLVGMTPPTTDRLVTVRHSAARVLVVAPYARAAARGYAAQVERRLARSAGTPVRVSYVWGHDDRLAFRAARELDRRPALAVLVGPPAAADDPAVQQVYAMLRRRGQQAVASSPLTPAPAGGGSASATPADADVAGGLPVSWLLQPASTTGQAGAGSGGPNASLAAAAGANVQTLVRACWPGVLAPDLASTRLGFSFAEARHTGTGVAGASDAAVASVLQRLRLWGFSGTRLTLEQGGWQPPRPGPVVCFRMGFRDAAESLAGDLGLPATSVVRADDSPRPVVLALAG